MNSIAMLTLPSLHGRLCWLARSANQPRSQGYHRYQSNERDCCYYRQRRGRRLLQGKLISFLCSIILTTPSPSEHFLDLHFQMGRFRHLSRRYSRQARLQLVRLVDHLVQSLRRFSSLLPSRELDHQNLFSFPKLNPQHPRWWRPETHQSWSAKGRHGFCAPIYLSTAKRLVSCCTPKIRSSSR